MFLEVVILVKKVLRTGKFIETLVQFWTIYWENVY